MPNDYRSYFLLESEMRCQLFVLLFSFVMVSVVIQHSLPELSYGKFIVINNLLTQKVPPQKVPPREKADQDRKNDQERPQCKVPCRARPRPTPTPKRGKASLVRLKI